MSDRDLLEQARAAIKLATARGAQGVRATVRRSTDSSVERRDGKVDRVRESTSMSLGVTLFVDGRYSSSSTSDLRPEALARFIEESVGMARALAIDPARGLPEPDRYAGRLATELRLLDPGVRVVAPEWRRQAASELEAGARSLPEVHKQILSVQSTCSTSLAERAKATSNGMEGMEASSSFTLTAFVTVRDAAGRKPAAGWSATTVLRDKLPSPSQVGQIAARRAFRSIGAAPLATGEYRCVVENAAAGRLLDAWLSALEGGNIQQKRSFLADRFGQTIAHPCVSIVDDPHVVEGLGSCTFDEEGMATRSRPIVQQGILRNGWFDTYYARKLKREATTGMRSNLVFERGTRELAGLLEEMGSGILITRFIGGNSNVTTGDFSFGVQGHRVEGGRITGAINEMNLSGSHLTFWRKLVELGSDPYLFSANRRPSLRFDTVQFSGRS